MRILEWQIRTKAVRWATSKAANKIRIRVSKINRAQAEVSRVVSPTSSLGSRTSRMKIAVSKVAPISRNGVMTKEVSSANLPTLSNMEGRSQPERPFLYVDAYRRRVRQLGRPLPAPNRRGSICR